MRPNVSRIAITPPPTYEKRLEVMTTFCALVAEDNKQLAWRRAEVTALRCELEEIKRDLRRAHRDWVSQTPSAIRARILKYDPDQPRIPAGNPDGGEWTTGDTPNSATQGLRPALAARSNAAECDLQYKQDTFICQSVGTPLCWASAMERYAACLAGHQIPALRL
jgi:hypothetical protein